MLLINVEKYKGSYSARLLWERPVSEPGIGCGSHREYDEAIEAAVSVIRSLGQSAVEGLTWRPVRGVFRGWLAEIVPDLVRARVWQTAAGFSAAFVLGARGQGSISLGMATDSTEAQALVAGFLSQRLPALDEALSLFALPKAESPHQRLEALSNRSKELWDQLDDAWAEQERLDNPELPLPDEYYDVRRRRDMLMTAKTRVDREYRRAMTAEHEQWERHFTERHSEARRPDCDYCRAAMARHEAETQPRNAADVALGAQLDQAGTAMAQPAPELDQQQRELAARHDQAGGAPAAQPQLAAPTLWIPVGPRGPSDAPAAQPELAAQPDQAQQLRQRASRCRGTGAVITAGAEDGALKCPHCTASWGVSRPGSKWKLKAHRHGERSYEGKPGFSYLAIEPIWNDASLEIVPLKLSTDAKQQDCHHVG